jgi:hypothetical protein
MRYVVFVETIVLILGASGASWGQEAPLGDSDPLPLPPPSAAVQPERGIEHPFERIGDQAGSMRVMFEGPGPGNTQIVIREILVGPKALVRIPALPGPALVDLRSGAATLRLGDRSELLALGSATSVAPGEQIEIQNAAEDPLVVRLYVVEAR